MRSDTSSPFAAEPPFRHGQPPRVGLLFCNLGTPASPGTADVRRFLAEFLSDARVVEIPRLLWLLILHGVILRVRPARSAAKYASIWLPEGSPLKVWTDRLVAALQQRLNQRNSPVRVQAAMRYGADAIAQGLDALKAAGATRVLVVPAYPQYSATTTASLFDAVYAWAARVRNLPELRFVNRYHDHPAYIEALADSVRRHWAREGRGEQLVMSFHGVPERTLQLGDPYHCECFKTARLLAEALELPAGGYKVTFQSRLGRAKWLQPYTEPTLIELAQSGVRQVDVICPGFICDCLETLEEINLEAREAYIAAGGERFGYIPCLNADPLWVAALDDIARSHMSGWPLDGPADDASLRASRERALALGAPD
ncbi:MAG: ferrochelatase [Rhodoferax sp.]|nr:ferrochelatase [Rhodoferax sp.]